MSNDAAPRRGQAAKLAVAGLAALAAVCCASAIVAFGASSHGPVSLLAPKPVWVKGVEYMPVSVVAQKGTTIAAEEKFLEGRMGHHFQLAAKPLKIVHKFVHKKGTPAVAHPRFMKKAMKVAQAIPIPRTAHHARKAAQHHAAHRTHLQAHGKYGHLAESILASQHGANRIDHGHILRGAAPSVPYGARQGVKKSKAAVNFEAATLADALKDCSTDAGDDCNNFLHPNGKSLRAFEKNQDAADSGLFSNFEAAQQIPDARKALPGGMVHGGMLAQKSDLDFYGIPNGGSLPGDTV